MYDLHFTFKLFCDTMLYTVIVYNQQLNTVWLEENLNGCTNNKRDGIRS